MSWLVSRIESLYKRTYASSAVLHDRFYSYRVVFAFLLLIFFLPSWSWMVDLPTSFYLPPYISITSFFSSFPSNPIVIFSDILIVVLFWAILVGIKSRTASFLSCVLLIVMQSFSYSVGKIDHDILFLFSFIVLASSNGGAKYAFVRDSYLDSIYVDRASNLLALFIGFGMLTSAVPKLLSWIDFSVETSAIWGWYLRSKYILFRDPLFDGVLFHLRDWMVESIEYLIVLFELLALPSLLLGRRFWIAWLTIACVFHLSILIFLGIDFDFNLLGYGYFLLLPLLSERDFSKPSYLKFIIILGSLWAVNALVGRIFYHSPLYWELPELVIFYLKVLLWIIMVCSGLFQILMRKNI